MDDIFDEDGDELEIASKDYQKSLNSIENSAFHEAYDQRHQEIIQKAFDCGYKLAFPFFQKASYLDGIADVLLILLTNENDKKLFFDLKPRIADFYLTLEADLEQKIRSDLENKRFLQIGYNCDDIELSPNCKSLVENIQSRLIELVTFVHLQTNEELMNQIKNIKF